MNKKNISQAGPHLFKGKRVLVRVDFNVPQNEDLSVADDSRIKSALPTIEFLVQAGARVVLVSHLGRPKGPTPKFSLKPVADHLARLLGRPVRLVVEAPPALEAIGSLADGDVCLLENIRFHAGEEKNDPEFARNLALMCDIYVNDAFGTAHRAHASTAGVASFVRPALAGLLIDREVRALSETLHNPARPFATIIGGAKVSSKIGVLENLIACSDVLVIGGAMAFSFLKARGLTTGRSLVEDDRLDFCRQLEEKASQRGVRLILPVDVICTPELKAGAPSRIAPVESISADELGADIGPATVEVVRQALADVRTVLWNGPMGVFEIAGFDAGTNALVDMLVELTARGVKTIVGGGDSVAAIESRGVAKDAFSHVSTGGGATLEFIEGLELPGVACLDEAESAGLLR